MTKTLATLAATVAALTALAAPAVAAQPIPTTPCELQDFLGFDNVMACEGVNG